MIWTTIFILQFAGVHFVEIVTIQFVRPDLGSRVSGSAESLIILITVARRVLILGGLC